MSLTAHHIAVHTMHPKQDRQNTNMALCNIMSITVLQKHLMVFFLLCLGKCSVHSYGRPIEGNHLLDS